MPAVGPRREFAIKSAMERPGLSPTLLAATLFLSAPTLWAEDNPLAVKPAAPPVSAMRASRADELLKRFDKNGDGKLDDNELADAHEAMLKEQLDRQATQAARPNAEQFRARMLELFDKNHDGKLDDEERAEARKYAEEHGLGSDLLNREEVMKRFDKNGDGKLDDAERAELMKFNQERQAQGPAQMRERLLVRFDTNRDGKIDATEMFELEKEMRLRFELGNPQRMKRLDKNGDGKLDDEEWAVAHAEILQWLGDAGPGMKFSAEEQAKLDRVAAEVARRKAAHEAQPQAQKEGGK